MVTYKVPFPWFGGKSRIAHLVWGRFGDVPNYCEPFFGSGAVLMLRPEAQWRDGRTETVNDLDSWLTNFWRAVKADPDGVASYADWPISEIDLFARGNWLFHRDGVQDWTEKMRSNPEFYDVKSAGWWVWGQCCWIGRGWGDRERLSRKRPGLSKGCGLNRKYHNLNAGRGVDLTEMSRSTYILEYMRTLAERLRDVRICCGDWRRILGPTPTLIHGTSGIFLDPPYSAKAGRHPYCYNTDDLLVAHDVREWALAHGDDPMMRIALCGYFEEHATKMPQNWECVSWKANLGYSGLRKSGVNYNRFKERIWFSPHCLKPQSRLF